MADKKTSKAVRRWKKDRDARRLSNDGDKMWDTLKGKDPRKRITLFNEDERKKHFAKKGAFGTVTCPFCGNASVLVANPDGQAGDAKHDYIMRHNAQKFLCKGSLVPTKDLFKE